jgi:hypothetical protein
VTRRHAIALIVAGVVVMSAEVMARASRRLAMIVLLPGHFIAGLPSLVSAITSSEGFEFTDVETIWPTIIAALFWWGVTFVVLRSAAAKA